MDSLAQLYAKHVAAGKFADRGTVHSYIDVYETLLAPYRHCKHMLEIGVYDGGGLLMWEQYFADAEVHGIDISETPLDKVDLRPMIAEGTHHIHIFNAAEPNNAENYFPGFKWDVIVEDSSHNFIDTELIHDAFIKQLAPGGAYIVEDIQALEESRWWFEKNGFEIIDMRRVKNRYDDVLAVKRGKGGRRDLHSLHRT